LVKSSLKDRLYRVSVTWERRMKLADWTLVCFPSETVWSPLFMSS